MTKLPDPSTDSQGQAGALEPSPAMIAAGVLALSKLCPLDEAFPVGMAEESVAAVYRAMSATAPA